MKYVCTAMDGYGKESRFIIEAEDQGKAIIEIRGRGLFPTSIKEYPPEKVAKDMRIWKFSLQITDRQTIPMPEGAKILSVQTQKNSPVFWCLVNANVEKVTHRTFAIYGTGNQMPPEEEIGRYIGTFQVNEGDFVGHVFEV